MLPVCLALFSPNLQSQDVTLGEAMQVANFGLNVYKAVDSNCDQLQAAGKLRVCKDNKCGEGNCISFRKRCNEKIDCKSKS